MTPQKDIEPFLVFSPDGGAEYVHVEALGVQKIRDGNGKVKDTPVRHVSGSCCLTTGG
jgi:hypothetical protein